MDNQIAKTDQDTIIIPWQSLDDYSEPPAYAARRAEYKSYLDDLMVEDKDGKTPSLSEARKIIATKLGCSVKTVERYTRGYGLAAVNDNRPSDYTQDTAIAILTRLSEGDTIQSICSDPEMPSVPTLWEWRGKIPGLDKAIERARRLSAQSMIDQAVDRATEAQTKDEAYAAKVATDALFRAAGMWDERFRDKYQGVSGGVQLNISTNLDLGQHDARSITVESSSDDRQGKDQGVTDES